MPRLPRKAPTATVFKSVFGATAGVSANDFYVLAYCREWDDAESVRDPSHVESTWIFRFVDGIRRLVTRVPSRVDDLWLSPSGIVYAVGAPRGVLTIRGDQCTETGIQGLRGMISATWGPGEDHLFASGHESGFFLYRRNGSWRDIPLPDASVNLSDVSGLNEQDVYTVGRAGALLHFDGKALRQLESPVNCWLTSIARMGSGLFCIGGYAGVLLYGDQRGWRMVDTGTDAPLLTVAAWRGGACYMTPDGLWWFDGKSRPRQLSQQRGRWVNSISDTLMIVRETSAWLFDGNRLTPLATEL